MKWSKLLVSTLVVSSLAAAAPAFAEREIADEPAWDSEPAPHNYDPQKREEADKRVFDKESFQLAANPVIVIDPGHGGDDPGAVGNGLKEKDLTLDIGLRAKNYIVANYPATVYMTRSSDTTVSLSSRTSFANAQNADFFVSMHINAATDASANGVETYAYPGSVNGKRLATETYNQLKSSFANPRGVKEYAYYVLTYTNMPATLGETGFISNASDASKLAQSSFRQTLATQYASGMHRYWWGF
ncbi:MULTISPECIES: N-acetylmuramoyl-L-alanine amidase family protein [Brevibacillus]|jgi:N-acetylmuramoyl-L-alanine amidase|uniref:N-acetylmuramoyl-L-alanine amidase n=1 Tax=Brevibacillus thermoruber TaxID=33942 RepID=A0A9X3TPG0_9BACL|nr:MULTISPECIES: N-acetylmuramoyl-L-alanine amidase [Brevibacillus]MDA5108381.1 N-acetylmuramoyl-L-alanine amidase [Brevibacillus thermoruber]TRY27359.1 N-acetylmuramoyl-L-alanine amidase [Brevibacillus sp. LEMMJ03]